MNNESNSDLKEIEAQLQIEQENKKRRLLKEVKNPQYTCLEWAAFLCGIIIIIGSLLCHNWQNRDLFFLIGILNYVGICQTSTN